MLRILQENPLLLLFTVAALGYPLGRVKVAGTSLGIAAVLFVGLAAGALHPALKLPELVMQLGLVLFVYTIGLASGASFFASLRRKGLRDNALVAAMLLLAFALTAAARALLHLSAPKAAGLFAGSLTNTPALASVIEAVQRTDHPSTQALSDPVVAYSMAYPVGVLGMMAALALAQRWFRVDYAQEARSLQHATGEPLQSYTLKVHLPQDHAKTLGELSQDHRWEATFGRVKRGDDLSLALASWVPQAGDLLTVVCRPQTLPEICAILGEITQERLDLDRSKLDYRRILVSNPKVAGQRLSDLDLPQHLGAIVTRLRRGDIELVPHGHTTLELGDRVRVLTHRDQIEAVTRFFGDSYKAASEMDILSFGLGLGLGLTLGLVPIPLPGDLTLKLGIAGGPLVVALVLGALGRTGPLVWGVSHSVNLTLRQLGLVLFLAGVGTRAGQAFGATLASADGLALLGAGALITTSVGLTTLWVGHRLLKIPLGLLAGILAGLQTQPAVLAFAQEQTRNDLPNVGYATVFPTAMILKIALAQLFLAW